jgi:hypothetical protein
MSGDRNQIIRIIKYEIPVIYGFEGRGGRNKNIIDVFGGDDLMIKKDRKYTIRKIAENIHDLAEDNFTRKDRFVTLGFAQAITDLKTANYEFLKFIKRVEYYLESRGYDFKEKPLKYLAGIEFKQENRESIHYHTFWNLPFIEQKILLEIWGVGQENKGSVYIRKIYNVSGLGDYLLKYISKSIGDERFQNNKAYLCSRGLKRREYSKLNFKEGQALEKNLKDMGIKKTYEIGFMTENNGYKTIMEYNLEKT